MDQIVRTFEEKWQAEVFAKGFREQYSQGEPRTHIYKCGDLWVVQAQKWTAD